MLVIEEGTKKSTQSKIGVKEGSKLACGLLSLLYIYPQHYQLTQPAYAGSN